jgi:hypothetical protein
MIARDVAARGRRRTRRALLAVSLSAWLCIGAGGIAHADPPPSGPAAAAPKPTAGPASPDGRAPDQLRKEVQERMRALRAWRIVEELKLDESASARLFPILAKYDEREMALAAERRDIVKDLRAELAAPAPDDRRLTKDIDRLLANRARKHALHDDRIKELRRALTPVQQAKLALLLPRLEAELATWMHDAAGGRDIDTGGP